MMRCGEGDNEVRWDQETKLDLPLHVSPSLILRLNERLVMTITHDILTPGCLFTTEFGDPVVNTCMRLVFI